MASNGSPQGWVPHVRYITTGQRPVKGFRKLLYRFYFPEGAGLVIIDVMVIWLHMRYGWAPSVAPNAHICDAIQPISFPSYVVYSLMDGICMYLVMKMRTHWRPKRIITFLDWITGHEYTSLQWFKGFSVFVCFKVDLAHLEILCCANHISVT